MRYRNPRIPEGINVSDRHPLREFVVLAGGALLLVLLAAFLIRQFSAPLARLLPFENETRMVPEGLLKTHAGHDLEVYIDGLAARLGNAMDLPTEIRVHLYVRGGETFNAFATLGGNVLLYRGLLEQLPNENALAMLLAHEMAHVQHRDPIVGIAQAAALQLVFGLLFGDPNLAVLGDAGLYSQLHFSRDMEREADATALAAVHMLYGHVAGAQDLFRIIQARRAADHDGEPPAFFNSHPLDAQRLQAIREAAAANGWSLDGATTPLPRAYQAWMEEAAHNRDGQDADVSGDADGATTRH